MQNIILVAGGTGKLGEKIVKALLGSGAEVRVPVRASSPADKRQALEKLGAKVMEVDMANAEDLRQACTGVSCVVSTLQGLRDVIFDVQKNLLDAAIAAGVPRFIPSDFSLDFTRLPAGGNRNFDLRREFQQYLESTSIQATSVFNGAFAEVLSYNMPVLDAKKKTAAYWDDKTDWHLDFTTMDDTAAFTAAAALDASTPRKLNIAGFQISPQQLATLAGELTQSSFELVSMGSLEQFGEYTRRERAANPAGEQEVFPRWQSAQYIHDMFSTHHESLDNGRYPDLSWHDARQFLATIL